MSSKQQKKRTPVSQSDTKSGEENEETDVIYIPVIIKTDVIGSIDAIEHEIKKLVDEKTNIKIVRADIGAISENDIKAAGGDSRAIVLGFNTKVENGVQELAGRDDITVMTFDIIYKLTEWLEQEIENRKPSVEEKQVHGTVTVLKLFSQTKKSQVLGGRVESGRIVVGDKVNILRRDEHIGTGIIKELQTQKQSTKEVSEGNEFGMKLETTISVVPKDTLESST